MVPRFDEIKMIKSSWHEVVGEEPSKHGARILSWYVMVGSSALILMENLT